MKYILFYVLISACSCAARESKSNINSNLIEDYKSNGSDNVSAKKIINNNDSCQIMSYPQRSLNVNTHYDLLYLNDSMYQIRWGFKHKSYLSKSLYKKQGNGVLYYLTSNKDAIFLFQSCGPSCKRIVILPLNKEGVEYEYYLPFALDIENNLIVYSPGPYLDNVFLIIENFLTKEQQMIEIQDLCNAVYKGDCIKCIYFKDTKLRLLWDGESHENKNDLNKYNDTLIYINTDLTN